VFVARGAATLDGHVVGEGDAVRLTDEPERPLVAGADGAEVVVWETA
jgi:hypothetical protein